MGEAFDHALRELSRVIDELTQAAPDDFATRGRLMHQRDRLRDEVARLRDEDGPVADRPIEDIRRELSSLEKQADQLQNQKINAVSQAGGGRGGEMGTLGVSKLNRQISDASGLTAIQQRIHRLRSILDDRQADQPGS